MKHLVTIIMAASISLGGCVCLGAGWVYEFDGVDDYVEIADSDSLDAGSMTFSAWILFDDLVSSLGVASKRDTSNTQNSWNIFSGIVDYRLRFQITESGGAGGTTVVSLGNLTALAQGVWYHVAFTADGTNLIAYINGAQDGIVGAAFPVYAGTADVLLGAMGGYTEELDGQIHAARIHNPALSAAEIRGLYKAGGGRNDFGALSIVLPRADDQSLVYSLDRPVTAASTGDVLAEDAVITSKDAARNYGLAKGGVTIGPAAIALPAP